LQRQGTGTEMLLTFGLRDGGHWPVSSTKLSKTMTVSKALEAVGRSILPN
ncbi:hypothetical protein L195_g063176, partial [Trifolium pratense]